jgi:hypothetical protein
MATKLAKMNLNFELRYKALMEQQVTYLRATRFRRHFANFGIFYFYGIMFGTFTLFAATPITGILVFVAAFVVFLGVAKILRKLDKGLPPPEPKPQEKLFINLFPAYESLLKYAQTGVQIHRYDAAKKLARALNVRWPIPLVFQKSGPQLLSHLAPPDAHNLERQLVRAHSVIKVIERDNASKYVEGLGLVLEYLASPNLQTLNTASSILGAIGEPERKGLFEKSPIVKRVTFLHIPILIGITTVTWFFAYQVNIQNFGTDPRTAYNTFLPVVATIITGYLALLAVIETRLKQ